MPPQNKYNKHLQHARENKKKRKYLLCIEEKDVNANEQLGTEFERLEEKAAREWYKHHDNEEVVFDDSNELFVMTETSHPGHCERKGKATDVIQEIMKAAAKGDWAKKEAKISTLVKRGDSERMQRYRRERERNLAKEAKSMRPLSHWFSPSLFALPPPTSPLSLVIHIDEVEENEQIEEELTWDDHIAALKQVLKITKNISPHTQNRLQQIKSYMILRRNGWKAMKASLVLSETTNHGKYYARVLRAWANQWIKQRIIPHFRQGRHTKVKSLLEDEDIELFVSSYLREHEFTVTPDKLKAYLEAEVFPSLTLAVKPTTISEETVRKWMHKKGWTWGLRTKGVYFDGHERKDVIQYHSRFLKEMQDLESLMVEYDDKTLLPLSNPNLASGDRRQHILVTHDESTFQMNDDLKRGWAPKGNQPLRKKGLGRGLMVSDFLLDTVGRLAISGIEATPREACEIFEYGKNNDGYWTGEHLVKQVCNTNLILCFFLFLFYFNAVYLTKSSKRKQSRFLILFILDVSLCLHSTIALATQLSPLMHFWHIK
jgi:hypothetical protein